MTCCLPPWASIFWIMSLLVDSLFHRFLCTTTPLIRMIICCTLTSQFNTGNDRLLCKVFPASLKGPALAWFHKLPRGSLNSFGELWAAFVTQYLCSVRQKGNISSLQSIFKRDDESIREFTQRFGQAVQQIDTYSMDVVL